MRQTARHLLARLVLDYFRILAQLQLIKINLWRRLRGQKSIIIIGVTGSAGKTSTMHALVAGLKSQFQVKYSQKANSESGIPLNILGLSMKDYSFKDWLRVALGAPLKLLTNWQDYDIYVVEMGVDEPTEPKNMGYLLKIIRPQIAVFTSVTSVHSQQFEAAGYKDPLRAIAQEKGRLIASLPQDGWAILNGDDPLVEQQKKRTRAQIFVVGWKKEADLQIIRWSVSVQATKLSYRWQGEKYLLELPGFVLPRVYGHTFGFALAVAASQKIPLKKALANITREFRLPPGRSTLIKGLKGALIIDSSYNASPAAMATMLELLDHLGRKTGRKKVAILGDMRELGQQSAREHQQLARRAIKVVEEIILVGPEMKRYFYPAALKSGFSQKRLHWFATAGAAAHFLRPQIRGRELILVKGSQNTIFLEIIVESLMKDSSQAEELLCRRGHFWDRRRQPFVD